MNITTRMIILKAEILTQILLVKLFHHENLDKEVVIKRVSEKIFSLTLEQLQLQAKDVLIKLSW